MSISMAVYLRRADMLAPARWASAIRDAGFELQMDDAFDPVSFSGFLPCRHDERETGFEYGWTPVGELDDLDPEERTRLASEIGDRDIEISFSTRGADGVIAATIAAAVLCAATDGVFHDHSSGDFFPADEAVDVGRDIVAALRADTAIDDGVSATFHRAFDRALLPLLEALGFARCTWTDHHRGTIAAAAGRLLTTGRTLTAVVTCSGRDGGDLGFRLDHSGFPVSVAVPWSGQFLTSGANDFAPRGNSAQLDKAITFLAGAFAAAAGSIAAEFPDLATPVAAAATNRSWQEAIARAEVLWRDRFLRGPEVDREVAATVVFVGAKLLLLEVDGQRLSFKFDTRAFERDRPTTVSGWRTTAAGTPVATRLANGTNRWTFNHRGEPE